LYCLEAAIDLFSRGASENRRIEAERTVRKEKASKGRTAAVKNKGGAEIG